MGKVKSNLDNNLRELSRRIDKKGAVMHSIPFIQFDRINYGWINPLYSNPLYKPQYRKLCEELLNKYNVKRINLEEAFKISFENLRNNDMALTAYDLLRNFNRIYYKNEKELESFIHKTFREDRIISYFEPIRQNGNKAS